MTEQDATHEDAGWRKPFFTIWFGQLFSLIGSGLVQFALVWWITDTTGSATVLATATLVSILPGIVIGPFAGALVDRWNRRRTMIVADSAIALVSLLLAGLFLAGRAQIWHVYLVMAVRALGGSFHWPAMQASTSLMVPNAQLARVAGLNQTAFGVMNIITPPAGALLLSLLPVWVVLLIDVATAMIAVLALFLVHIPQPRRQAEAAGPGSRPASLWQDMGAGFRYVLSWPGLLILGLIATTVNFLVNPAFSLIPILVTRHFGGGAMQLGLINSTWGVGVIAGGLLLSAWGGFRKRIYTALFGLAGLGLGILVVGIAPPWAFWLAIAGIALSGFMNPISNGPLFAIFQASITPEMQGRVFSLISTVAGGITPLSLLIAGPLSDRLGVQVWYLGAGIVCVLMSVASLFSPVLLNIEEQGKALVANSS